MIWVAVPYPFKSMRQGLGNGRRVYMACIFGENELVLISLGGQDLGHVLICHRPVVHAIGHVGKRKEEIAITSLKPRSYRFSRALKHKRRGDRKSGRSWSTESHYIFIW